MRLYLPILAVFLCPLLDALASLPSGADYYGRIKDATPVVTNAWQSVQRDVEVLVDARISGATNAVAETVVSIVTNEVHSLGDWVEEWNPPHYGSVYGFSGPYYEGGETWSGFYGPKKGMGIDMSLTAVGDEFATRLVFVEDIGETSFTLTLTRSHTTENALGLARISDLAGHANRTDNPHNVTAAQVGAYTKEQTDCAISAATDGLASAEYIAATVTNVVRDTVGTVWDGALGVAWQARMHNGHLYYIAVTNRPPEGK